MYLTRATRVSSRVENSFIKFLCLQVGPSTCKLHLGNGAARKKISDLEQSLKGEVERNTNLEQYTRRENLRFNNIKESEDEDCKEVVYNIIERDLGIKTPPESDSTQCTALAREISIGADLS